MFPDSSVLEYILICWRLQLKAIGFLLHDDNSASIRDEMHDLLITCLLPRQRETKYRQKKARGRLKHCEVSFHSLATLMLPIMLSNQSFVLSFSESVSCHQHFNKKCEGSQHCLHRYFQYIFRNIALLIINDCLYL